jgi:hypothetical protein
VDVTLEAIQLVVPSKVAVHLTPLKIIETAIVGNNCLSNQNKEYLLQEKLKQQKNQKSIYDNDLLKT